MEQEWFLMSSLFSENVVGLCSASVNEEFK